MAQLKDLTVLGPSNFIGNLHVLGNNKAVKIGNATYSAGLHMGSGGVNRGLYDWTLGKWMVYADATTVHLNGNAATATSATKDGSGNTITSYYLPKANVSGTANYVPKFTATNTIGNSRIIDDGTAITLNSSTLIKATTSNYCDGLRICPATDNSWGIIYFSAQSTSTSGTHDGGWLVGRMGINAGAGVINDFTIEHNSSAAKGLTIHKADASMTLYGPKFNLANKAVSFVYNSTDKCIEFTFA